MSVVWGRKMNVSISLAPSPLRPWIAQISLRLMICAVTMPPLATSVMAASARPLTIVAFGDSLTAGYGVKTSESFPAQLQMALEAKGHKVTVTNAGVSGDTTSGGLERLDWALDPKPDALI